MLEIIAPTLQPPLPNDAVAALKSKLAESQQRCGTVYISPGSIHPHIAAVVWTSGDEAAHTVESVELLRTPEGATRTAQRLLDRLNHNRPPPMDASPETKVTASI